MFICTDCQKKYDIKPDFCDCGNNIFDEITEKTEKNTSKQIKKNKQEIFSLIFFITCIILSIFTLLFFDFPKTKENIETKEKTPTKKEIKNIPDIDSFWKNKPFSTIQKEIKKEEIIIEKSTPKKENKIQKIINSSKTTTKSNTQKKQETVKTEKKKEQTQTDKPQQIKSQAEKKPATTTVIDEKAEKEKYIKNLRNHLFKKINFAEFYENGECSISFKINQSGILTDKQITSPSTSIIINDAVFKAVSSTYKYVTPPKSLTNHTFIFKVIFIDDKYKVTLN